MKISDIKPNEKNPRVISKSNFEKLKKSITEFPKMMKLRPIVIDADNIIIGGNQRYNALIELNYKTIPDDWVVCADNLTPDELNRFLATDNSHFGDWDLSELQDMFDKEDLENWGVDLSEIVINLEEDSQPLREENAESDDFEPDEIDTPNLPNEKMVFIFSYDQANFMTQKIEEIKNRSEFDLIDKCGNEDQNANAIYAVLSGQI